MVPRCKRSVRAGDPPITQMHFPGHRDDSDRRPKCKKPPRQCCSGFFASCAAHAGHKALYFGFDEVPSILINRAQEIGLDFEGAMRSGLSAPVVVFPGGGKKRFTRAKARIDCGAFRGAESAALPRLCMRFFLFPPILMHTLSPD